MPMPTLSDTRPWYREPFVWMLIGLPFVAVVYSLYTAYLAYATRDGLVVDDYYQKGKEINRVIDRDHAAARLGLRAALELEPRRDEVAVRLSARHGVTLPEFIDLRWLHATRAGFDRRERLTRQRDGSYRADLPTLAPGHYYVQLEAQDWRLLGSLRVPAEIRTTIVPAPAAGPPAE